MHMVPPYPVQYIYITYLGVNCKLCAYGYMYYFLNILLFVYILHFTFYVFIFLKKVLFFLKKKNICTTHMPHSIFLKIIFYFYFCYFRYREYYICMCTTHVCVYACTHMCYHIMYDIQKLSTSMVKS